jgi:RNase P subunit RPR2
MDRDAGFAVEPQHCSNQILRSATFRVRISSVSWSYCSSCYSSRYFSNSYGSAVFFRRRLERQSSDRGCRQCNAMLFILVKTRVGACGRDRLGCVGGLWDLVMLQIEVNCSI